MGPMMASCPDPVCPDRPVRRELPSCEASGRTLVRETPEAQMANVDSTTERTETSPTPAEQSLSESLNYYDSQAKAARLWYQLLKVLVIGCGAAIPVLTTIDAPLAVTAV